MNKQQWESYYNAVINEDWEQAKTSLESLCAVEKKNPGILLKLGDICQRTGDAGGAITAYHKSACILKEQGFIQKALALYKIMLRLDPDNEAAIKTSRELLKELDKIHRPRRLPDTDGQKPAPVKEVLFGLGNEFDRGTLEKKIKALSKADWVEDQDTIHIPSLFESLSPDEIIQLLEASVPQRLSTNEVIIREGDTGDSIYLIQSGKAKVVTRILGEEIELAVLSAGDVFGEVAFLTGRSRTASVVAVDKIRVFEFKKFLLEGIFEKNPEALRRLHDFYECRIEDTLKKITTATKKIGH
jgi:CRP-like cAMP-binding protein